MGGLGFLMETFDYDARRNAQDIWNIRIKSFHGGFLAFSRPNLDNVWE